MLRVLLKVALSTACRVSFEQETRTTPIAISSGSPDIVI